MNPLLNSTILIVEDDPRMSDSLRYLLDYHGYNVQVGSNLFDALLMIQDFEYDLIILDIKLEDQSGFALMDYIAVKKLNTQIIIITGESLESNAITAIKKGAADYLKKPFDPDFFIESVNKILNRVICYREKEKFYSLIKSSREKFRNVVDSQKDYLCRLNTNYEITFVNRAFANLYRKKPKEMIGCDYKSLFHKRIRHGLFDKLTKLCSSSGTIQIDFKFVFKNRRSRFQQWQFQSILDEQGKVSEIQCTGRNINEERKTKNNNTEVNQSKSLSGIIVICSSCKMIRDDKGNWNQFEQFFMEHSEVKFSHSICPRCVTKLYPELYNDDEKLPV